MTLMICPKAGACDNKELILKEYDRYNPADHKRCVPHKRHGYCEHDNRWHDKFNDQKCPKCVPYVQHKVGDWVRVLGKTHGFSLEYSGFKVGDVCKITRAFSETAYGTGQFQLNNEIRYHFNQQDLLPIQHAKGGSREI